METKPHATRRLSGDLPFFCGLGIIAWLYVGLILAMVLANVSVVSWDTLVQTWRQPAIQSSIKLTLLSCTTTALLSILCAVPTGYLLARFKFRGRSVMDAIMDIPIVLPPLVVGLSLLILFNKVDLLGAGPIEGWLNDHGMSVTYSVAAVVLAQFSVATAFAVRMMKNTFEQIDPRCEDVAMTLGCNRSQAFWRVALPQAGQGVVAAGVLAWARALGEFGPILVFAGATRGRTEVLSTSVFLEINLGNIGGAAAVSLIMIALAISLISLIRYFTRSESNFF
ncbi:molybdenum ABC transporter permease [Oceaniferula spumae]|uniref:Molybdenum ABC transporter permease n=1 Tax=Oceaniferula spumae TaxID=2979115 RepID=A0AAT9FRM8_9BACT